MKNETSGNSEASGPERQGGVVHPLVVKFIAWAILASLAVLPAAGAYFGRIVLRLDRDCPALVGRVSDLDKHVGELRADTKRGIAELAAELAKYPRPGDLADCSGRVTRLEAATGELRGLLNQLQGDFRQVHPFQRMPQGPASP